MVFERPSNRTWLRISVISVKPLPQWNSVMGLVMIKTDEVELSSARMQQSSNAPHSTHQTAGSDWFFEYYARKCFKLTLFLLQQTLDSDWSMELQVYYINVDIYAE
jgi:hypothetical protein